MANPVVVDDPMALEWTYKPAQTKIVLKNLLNHSSGIFYGFNREKPGALPAGYTSEAYEDDHSIEKFFKILKVRIIFVCGHSHLNFICIFSTILEWFTQRSIGLRTWDGL